jgi:hypothetical protein
MPGSSYRTKLQGDCGCQVIAIDVDVVIGMHSVVVDLRRKPFNNRERAAQKTLEMGGIRAFFTYIFRTRTTDSRSYSVKTVDLRGACVDLESFLAIFL